MKGRKPKSAALHIVEGTKTKSRDNSAEPTSPVMLLKCPPNIKGAGRREWKRIAPILTDAGLLTEMDRAQLALYCDAWGRLVEAQRQLAEFGVVLRSPKGYPIQNPHLAIANKASEQVQKSLVEFGMSPLSRARVKTSKPPEESAFQKFLNS